MEQQPDVTIDFNNNGIPDYREGWFWRTALDVGSFFALTFAKPHTVAFKLAQQYRAKVRPEVAPRG